LTRLLEKHKGNVAAVIMEPKRDISPLPNFLEDVKTLCDKFNAVLIFDEITSAFRENPGPLHAKYKIYPDIAIFSKAVSNGYPMGIIAGVEKIMQIAQESFISSTTWTERIGPVAASATIKKFIKFNVHEHIGIIGDLVYNGWFEMAKSAGLEIRIQGLRSLLNFKFIHADDLILRTLFVQMMLQKGFLASNRFYAMYTHTEKSTQSYLSAAGEVFEQIGFNLRANTHEEKLVGPVAHAGFKRLN
jgi:glutamate-1-semialdehyde aminotransferase